MRYRMGNNLTWNDYYNNAKEYYKEFGNLKVGLYNCYNGVYLGPWLLRQIDSFNILSDAKKKKLEKLGCDWSEESILDDSSSKFDTNWMENYNLLVEYKKEYGHLLLSCLEVYKDVKLGAWLYRQRVANANNTLSNERVNLLLDLGVFLGSWDEDGWEYKYSYAKKYYEEHKNLNVPIGYMSGGFNLYSWIYFQKQKKLKNELSDERISRLNDIGIVWSKTYSEKWLSNYNIVKKFYMEFGSLDTTRNQIYDGINIDAWLNNQRRAKRGEKHRNINDEQIKLLDSLNMKW